ncbi:c-type cytochrome biogenesis protein CcmI [Halomonas daqiaonensis]|uniref:Cytochrome c-type biogenesis protein CcmH n=1 Tax=Halomonas daqiaonensis TaxID=650850 RepID=A0A1H7JHQ0_9GAMM|nr:c-type cytochrome biogenesis protein CcmI [Halomonas daqiaonensis]SEK74083.1 cytochrome c-type biogenesis protein CcmH [Halomonas daqiaonensis]
MNGIFLLLALALCLVALAFLIVPLLREPLAESAQSHRETHLALHRERTRELDHDLAAGTLTRAQHDAAMADLERELLDSGAIDTDHHSESSHRPRRLAGAAAFVSVAALPFMAVGTYLWVGHADEVFATRPAEQRTVAAEPQAVSERQRQREFQMLTQQLQGRLAEEPGDLESWILLGRTLVFLEDLEAAERAFREAMAHGGDRDPDLLTRYAEVLADRQGTLDGEPQVLIERALELDPDHAQGLWMAGSLALQRGELAVARRHWERLLAALPPDSDEAEVIRGNLMQLSPADVGGTS